ncbi:MAG TPA: DUF4340 domain-containing protein [Verrucomicrobiota bacterium]|nr:DUF4340 domain-containing protein [Verrucomicrobiota bacterium]
MNSKSTWNWIFVAAALFAFIFFYERHIRKPLPGPVLILPELKDAAIGALQVSPAGQLEIRAILTNGVWKLTRPVAYPAQSLAIESLLYKLETLAPAAQIGVRELRDRPQFDQEFGFDQPQFSIIVENNGRNTQILVGKTTAPGDQVYLQVVGVESVYVVDAELLRFLPVSGDEWRDTTLLDLRTISFDQINVRSGDLTITFQQNPTNNAWRMTHPLQARADSIRLLERLQMLQTLQVSQFVTDDPSADLELYGLQPPELELSFDKGTNRVTALRFGKTPTNDTALIYAKRDGIASVVTVSAGPVAPWRARVDDMRDRHFVTFDHEIGAFEFRGENNFDIQRSSNAWKIVQETFPVDILMMNDFVVTLGAMQITQFKDAVTAADLESFGLASPSRTIKLISARAASGTLTNEFLLLSFGLVDGVNVYARRSDEDAVYTVRLEDFVQLPDAAWQLRERRLWNFNEDAVARLIIKQNGKTRELIRHGTNSWSFAPGSQGVINEFAVEEAANRFGELAVTQWVARGNEYREPYGIGSQDHSITLVLKNGQRASVEFGRMAPTRYPYAATMLDGETWVFEFPFALYQLVNSYLSIPADVP